MKISYACDDLIAELEEDIAEFGPEEKIAVWIRKYPDYGGIEFIVNYDLLTEELPVDTAKECGENERIAIMKAEDALEVMKEQNKIL